MVQNKPLSTRGKKFTGKVIRAKMAKTVTVEWERQIYIQKYERYKKARTTIKAHNPETINAVEGDIVTIEETRPISKTKNFIVTKIVKKAGEENNQAEVKAK